ncbi:hypothetical protein DPMN_080793, partial [Dreissena polymorpha]
MKDIGNIEEPVNGSDEVTEDLFQNCSSRASVPLDEFRQTQLYAVYEKEPMR